MKNTDDEILAEFSVDEGEPKIVEKEKILKFMKIDDIETKGLMYFIISDKRYYSLINPKLLLMDYYDFSINFLEQCIQEDPDGDWSMSRYIAAYELSDWLRGMWHDTSVPRKTIVELKERLARFYKASDPDIRNALLCGTLEHAFEDDEVANFFLDWKEDPELKDVYEEAVELGRWFKSWKDSKREPPPSEQ